MSILDYSSRVKTGAQQPLAETSDISFALGLHSRTIPTLLVITILQSFSPGEPHQPNGYAGMEDKVRKYLFKNF